jgi:hypothetical protein
MNQEAETNQHEKKIQKVQISLQWGDASQISTVYANQLYITHSGGEFYLVFGELAPITNMDKDNLPEYLEIKPVAKIAITPENMLRFSEVIQTNINNFERDIIDQESNKES